MGRQRHDIGHRKRLARLARTSPAARRERRAERRAAALDRWQAEYDLLLAIQDREIERRRRAAERAQAERAARAVLALPVAVPMPTPVPRPEPDPAGPDVSRRCAFEGCNRRAERRHKDGRYNGYRQYCRRHRRKVSEQQQQQAAGTPDVAA
jgi:hypothetical protein